jgi:hypothetical protein
LSIVTMLYNIYKNICILPIAKWEKATIIP